jgi:hypothetical protein
MIKEKFRYYISELLTRDQHVLQIKKAKVSCESDNQVVNFSLLFEIDKMFEYL